MTTLPIGLRARLDELLAQPCPACGARPYAVAGPGVATIHADGCEHLTALPASRRSGRVENHPVHAAAAPEALRARLLSPDRHRGRPFRTVVVDDDLLEGRVSVFWHLDRAKPWRCTVHGYLAGPGCRHTQAAAAVLLPSLFGVHGGHEQAGVGA